MDSAERKDQDKFSVNLSVNASSLNTSSATSYASSRKHFCKTAHLRGNLVSVRIIRKKNIKMDRRTLEDMQQVAFGIPCQHI
nr:hypothetical protein BaRGS_003757 [Batillaria attramentaria]